MSDLKICTPITDNDFANYYTLRWLVLRKPWNQPPGSEKDELESEALHRMVCDREGIVRGTGRLHLNSPAEAQIRYMAVHPEFHRQGIGRMILMALEAAARGEHAKRIVLNARDNALAFYKALGYVQKGKSYVLYDSIQHFLMEKILL